MEWTARSGMLEWLTDESNERNTVYEISSNFMDMLNGIELTEPELSSEVTAELDR